MVRESFIKMKLDIFRSNKTYLLLTLAPLLWSGNMILGRAIHNQIAPFALALDRWFITAVLLLPIGIILWMRSWQEIKHNILKLIVLGILATSMFSALLYLGLHYTTVVNASIISATDPALIVLLSLLLLEEKIYITQGVGIFLSLAGVVFIVTRGQLSMLLSVHLKIGDLYVFIAVICWALYSVLLKKFKLKLNPFLLLFLLSVVGSIVLFPCAVIETIYGSHTQYSYSTMVSILYISIFSTICAFTCWTLGVKSATANIAGYFLNLIPVFCAIMAVLFLGEKLHFYHILGCCVVFIGVYLATRKSKELKSKLVID